MGKVSPRSILFEAGSLPKILPVCEHLAGNEKFLAKALVLQQQLGNVFDITCDLEDGAPIGNENAFLDAIVTAIESSSPPTRIGVRVHDSSHQLFAHELETLVKKVGQRIAYLTIPKVKGAGEVSKIVDFIASLSDSKIPPIPLHVLIETPGALREVAEIALIDQVESLDFGLMDFISEHRGAISATCMRSPLQFEHALLFRARAEIAAAALGAGKIANHNVCVALESPTSARDDARRAKQEFGFQRMWSIHPAQIEPIIEGMSESSSEVEKAKEIILRAMEENWGPISFKNQLHDRASYRYYWLVLERARASGMAFDTSIDKLFI